MCRKAVTAWINFLVQPLSSGNQSYIELNRSWMVTHSVTSLYQEEHHNIPLTPQVKDVRSRRLRCKLCIHHISWIYSVSLPKNWGEYILMFLLSKACHLNKSPTQLPHSTYFWLVVSGKEMYPANYRSYTILHWNWGAFVQSAYKHSLPLATPFFSEFHV